MQTTAADLREDQQMSRRPATRLGEVSVRVGWEASRHVTQVLMDKLDCDRALANSGGDPFHRTISNVSYRKNSGDAGFEQAGIALQRPAFRPLAGPEQVR